jgi:hypothetical protein
MVKKMVSAGLMDVLRAFYGEELKTDDRLKSIYGEELKLDYQRHWPQVQDPKLGLNNRPMFKVSKQDPTLVKYLSKDGKYVKDWTAKQVFDDVGKDPLTEGAKFMFGFGH